MAMSCGAPPAVPSSAWQLLFLLFFLLFLLVFLLLFSLLLFLVCSVLSLCWLFFCSFFTIFACFLRVLLLHLQLPTGVQASSSRCPRTARRCRPTRRRASPPAAVLTLTAARAGILVALPEDHAQMPPNTAQGITPFGRDLLRFVALIHKDITYADDSLIKSCVNLLGDLCSVPGMAAEMTAVGNKDWIVQFVAAAPAHDSRAVQYTQKRLMALGVHG